jgi:superoxide dismutase, Fe-Mn family
MTHALPSLPYDLHALEPAINAETLTLHHGKHHRSYVDKLNAALIGYPEYQNVGVEELLRRLDSIDPAIRDEVRNQGGGHANHSLFWSTLAPQSCKPSPAFLRQVSVANSSALVMKELFAKASERLFGSGWVFLTCRAGHSQVDIVPLPNQDSPLSQGATPILAFDAWEHAYYLQYQNERARWVDAWWSVIDWTAVEHNYQMAQSRYSNDAEMATRVR